MDLRTFAKPPAQKKKKNLKPAKSNIIATGQFLGHTNHLSWATHG